MIVSGCENESGSVYEQRVGESGNESGGGSAIRDGLGTEAGNGGEIWNGAAGGNDGGRWVAVGSVGGRWVAGGCCGGSDGASGASVCECGGAMSTWTCGGVGARSRQGSPSS